MGATPSPAGPRRAARIIIADDHTLVRAGLREMLAGEPDFAIVGEAANGAEALERCRALRPDLVLLDLRMPILDGLASARAIRAEFPAVAVLIISIFEQPDYVRQALAAGAVGYVLKSAPRAQFLAAMRRALQGDAPPEPERLARLAQQVGRGGAAPVERLTPREGEVLRLLARGYTNRAISAELGIAPGTTRGHVERILGKLGATDRTQAAVRAVALRLIPEERD